MAKNTGSSGKGKTTPGKSALPFHTTAVLLVVLAVIAVYSNTFTAPFVFDDIQNIVENSAIHDLSHLLPPGALSPTRHVGYASFALNYAIGTEDVRGYHLVNVLIHLAASLLVYCLALLLFGGRCAASDRSRRRFAALFAALLFACHPLQTEAVTYIVQRFASLAALFYLLSMMLYLQAHRDRKTSRRARALLLSGAFTAALLAMGTKETAFTLPLAIALCDVFAFPGPIFNARRARRIVPFLLLLPVVPLSLLFRGGDGLAEGLAGAARETAAIPRGIYFATEMRVIVTYLRLIFLPTGQNLDYDYPLARSLLSGAVLRSMLLHGVILVSALLVAAKERARKSEGILLFVSFGILFFYLALSVESSFFPIRDVIFEHRLYLPLAGGAIALGALLFTLLPSPTATRGRATAALATALIVVPLAAAAHSRNEVWKSDETLWRDTVSKSPEKARPRNNLGIALFREGKTGEALVEYRLAVRFDPGYAEARTNLGIALASDGRLDEAIDELRSAARIDPSSYRPRYNLGVVYRMAGRRAEAIAAFENTLLLEPGFEEAREDLRALRSEEMEESVNAGDDRSEGTDTPEEAVEALNRGLDLAGSDSLSEAVAAFREAIRSAPRYVMARYNLATALQQQGDADAALRAYEDVLAIDPDYAKAWNNIGSLHQGANRLADAASAYARAVEIDPDYRGARYNLVNILAALGRGEEALAQSDELVRRFPDYAEGRKLANRVRAAFRPAGADAGAR